MAGATGGATRSTAGSADAASPAAFAAVQGRLACPPAPAVKVRAAEGLVTDAFREVPRVAFTGAAMAGATGGATRSTTVSAETVSPAALTAVQVSVTCPPAPAVKVTDAPVASEVSVPPAIDHR